VTPAHGIQRWLHCYAATKRKVIPPASGVALQSYLAARFKRIPPVISAESRQSATGGNRGFSKTRFTSTTRHFRGVDGN